MNELIDNLETLTGLEPVMMFKVALSLFVLLFVQIARAVVIQYVATKTTDRKTVYQTRKSTAYIGAILYILIFGRIWFDAFSSISTFLGLASAGIAIAMRDPLVSLAGWFYILWNHPFRVGDRIQINGRSGDVIDQKLFTFTILEIGEWVDADQSTGREILIPNGYVFIHELTNYSLEFPFIWNEIQLPLTFESNWKKAKSILEEIAGKVTAETNQQARQELDKSNKDSMITYRKLTPIVYLSVKENGIVLFLRYLSPVRGRRGFENEIWLEVIQQISEADDLQFAYQTMRLTREGGQSRDFPDETTS